MEIYKLDDFITQMPKGLTNISEKARFLYLELGKRSFYDGQFDSFMYEEGEQSHIYSEKIYTMPNIVICTTLIKQYKKLLDKASIKNEINIDGLGHYSLDYYDEKGQIISTDLTNDLKNIQFGCSTSHFGKSVIKSETLRNMDILLGYITKEKGYCNDYWYILRKKLEEAKISNKIKFEITLQSLKEFGDLTKLGEIELFSMYEKFVRYCLKNEFKVFFYSTRTNNNPQEFWIELSEKDKIFTYKLNRKSLEFEKTEEIEKNEKIK